MNAFKKTLATIGAVATLGATALTSTQASAWGGSYDYCSGYSPSYGYNSYSYRPYYGYNSYGYDSHHDDHRGFDGHGGHDRRR